jgi:hypothetical protein
MIEGSDIQVKALCKPCLLETQQVFYVLLVNHELASFRLTE